MALFDDASLVVTPNGYKAGTLYSIKPTSGAGDMTVVRATTATRVNSAGLIESVANNVPRLDYSNGTCPSILVEPQRTNLIPYSEQFDNANWALENITITANATTSPNGTTNADRMFETALNGSHGIYQNLTLSTGTNYAVSCYVKKGNRDYCGLQFWYNITNGVIAFFNLANGTLVYEFAEGGGYSITNSNITNVGNGWYRLSAIVQVGIASSYPGLVMASTQWSTGTSYDNPYTGDVSKYVDTWGFQLEAGAYPTSYIPTTSAAVTRNADVISKTGISALIGQTEGTLFVDVDYDSAIVGNKMLLGLANNVSNFIYLFIDISTIVCNIFSGGTPQCSLQYILPSNARYKIAVAYKNNDFLLYVNGTQVAIDTSGSVPSTSVMYLGNDFTSVYNTENINSAVLFPTRLTNAELATLTT
jgi:hypothetical protein